MFEYLFPIFCFGLVVTGIVLKGLLTAADLARGAAHLEEEDPSGPTRNASVRGDAVSMANSDNPERHTSTATPQPNPLPR